MRKIIVIIAYFICIEGTIAQIYTHTENYILSTTCLDADCVKKSQTIQYFDGLGRLKQSIGIKATPKGRDLVTPTEYDNYGRQTKDYLPIPQSGTQNGGFYQNPLSNAPSVYGNESIYSEKILENSPLDRVLGQIQVGNDWRNKPVRFQYEANQTTDGVYKMTTRTTWEQGATKSTISIWGTYADVQLYKTTTTDEDGNPSIEFKNGEGQTLLVRKILEGKNIDTYYIYNEYNQLAFVIPPLAVEEIAKTTNLSVLTIDSLCYQYRYDGRGRMVEKKLPSKGWEYMVYDQLDRLVLTQDANLRGTGNNFKAQGWIFTKYDQFNRVVYTGFFRNSSSREQMQTALNNIRSNHHESRSHTPFNFNNNDIYYTRNAFPKSSLTILSVNYYDTYPANSPAMPNDIWGQETLKPEVVNHRSTKGLALVSMVKNIEDDGWTKNYTYYDTKGRVIGTLSQNHLGGYTKTESLLDFSGIAQQTNTYHKRQSSDKEIKIAERFEYNAHNPALLERHYHQVNEEAEELLAEHSYNEIGQLATKKVGGTQGNPLQTINYQYNIRGWMTGINNPNNLGENYFGYKINYQNPISNGVEKGLYNGNISQVDWATKNDGIMRRYTYQYDGLNRLLSAIYSKPNATIPSTNAYNESLTYDANGNILTLNRFGDTDGNQAMKIDELVYEYRGNQLQKITDNSLNISGYPQGGNGILYDPNGNMTNHLDKGISRIEYNFLNLPSRIIKRTGDDFVKYTYRADGVKVNKMSHNRITNYLDGFQYEMSYAKHSKGITIMSPHSVFFLTAEGYYDVDRKQYVYNYTDHLGNIRLSYSRSGIIETNHYYPFGLKHEGYDTFPKSIGGGYQYKYNGKELQTEIGMYDYGARFYMPDIGRWGVIDPLAEKMTRYSPYNYAFNNPIRFIDPDGRSPMPPDDHFNQYGKFLYSDNKSTNNIIVHIGKGEYKLSQLDYSKQGTRKAVSNIIAHYASEKGMQGYVGVGTFEKGSALTNESKNIFFNVESLKGKKYDNIYNLKSSLNHEIGHVNEGDIDEYSFEQHAKIYLAEASHSDFSKTTENYKYSNAVQFAQRVLNAEENDKTYKKSFLGMINTYNKQNTGNVFIDIGTTGGLMRGAVITPFINNIEKPSKTYEDIKDARH